MSNRLYLAAAESIRNNQGQWQAYESEGHCVVLAGPGSGKTKTLTLKLARILGEDVAAPRGVACITYNNECSRELENRLQQLGVEAGGRAFIGTVHSFSLTQILLPYAKTAQLGLPDPLRVATKYEREAALEAAYRSVVRDGGRPENMRLTMDVHRLTFLDRNGDGWRQRFPDRTALVERYEAELRGLGVIDFEDMPLLALRALRENEWLQKAILAKYPVLAVDEYQDLGRPLDRMVSGLCFRVGCRLFAVGDVDQSIYGFIGAEPALLKTLSEREDVEVVNLRLNYRCGSRIVTAAGYALGEERDYAAPDGAEQGTIYFHPRLTGQPDQANNLFATIVPAIRARIAHLPLGEIAILYATAGIGNTVENAARRHGFEIIRTDRNALYPRGSPIMRWLESCATWCCGGWRSARPRFARILRQGLRVFHEAAGTSEERADFQRRLVECLWSARNEDIVLVDWLAAIRRDLVDPFLEDCNAIDEEIDVLETFMQRVGPTGDRGGMTLGQFANQGIAANRINLSTLHSAKGREFQVVILFGMDQGIIPRNGAAPRQQTESRRLFYVGFTRAKSEVHLIYSDEAPSQFVTEVRRRLDAER